MKCQKSAFLDSIWKENNQSKRKILNVILKSETFKTYALAPAWGRLLTPEFRKIWIPMKFHEYGRCSTSSSAILLFPQSKKSIRIYDLKHKSMLQIDFGPKRWFPIPKSLPGLRTGTRLQKSWFTNGICKKMVSLFLVVFGVKIMGIPLNFSSNLSGGGVKRRWFWAQSAKTGSQKHQATLYTS